jgi:hypothetical protein
MRPGAPSLAVDGSEQIGFLVPAISSPYGVYKTQLVVIEQALETASLMLGSDKSRGYTLEMICADFLAGARLENQNQE